VAVSTHASPQSDSPAAHWHAPPTQRWARGHTLPQAPQWALSVATGTQAPAQSASPAGHTQAPSTQLCPGPHTLPHRPQSVSLRPVSTQAIAGPTPQTSRGALHDTPHAPPLQT